MALFSSRSARSSFSRVNATTGLIRPEGAEDSARVFRSRQNFLHPHSWGAAQADTFRRLQSELMRCVICFANPFFSNALCLAAGRGRMNRSHMRPNGAHFETNPICGALSFAVVLSASEGPQRCCAQARRDRSSGRLNGLKCPQRSQKLPNEATKWLNSLDSRFRLSRNRTNLDQDDRLRRN